MFFMESKIWRGRLFLSIVQLQDEKREIISFVPAPDFCSAMNFKKGRNENGIEGAWSSRSTLDRVVS